MDPRDFNLAIPSAVDFVALIADLERVGFTTNRLSVIAGVDHQTAYKWKQGRQPRHHPGQIIIAIHRQIVGISQGKDATTADRRRYPRV